MTSRCSRAAIELYKIFVEGECIETNARTAEMAKLTENSFRDVNIAFANELSMICDKLDINVWELIKLSNRHPRVDILQPGPGVGGHCIAVDPWFIVNQTPEEAKLIHQARKVNDSKPNYVVNKIIAKARSLGTKRINCLGMAFKPDIDDLRESPAAYIIKMLANEGFDVVVVEPNISTFPAGFEKLAAKIIPLEELMLSDDLGVVAILVAHREFKMSDALRGLDVLDFCGAFSG